MKSFKVNVYFYDFLQGFNDSLKNNNDINYIPLFSLPALQQYQNLQFGFVHTLKKEQLY